jgi:hypothetical protein
MRGQRRIIPKSRRAFYFSFGFAAAIAFARASSSCWITANAAAAPI